MSALSVQPTFPIFTDADGQPLDNGYIWIGVRNLDPQTNPVNVFWDAALTVAAPRPIRTIGGYPSRNGAPGRLYVGADDYSVRVTNKNGTFVYGAPEASERLPFSLISGNLESDRVRFQPAGAGAVARSVTAKLQEFVSVLDFGAVGNGVANSTMAFAAAFATGKAVYVPSGTYLVDMLNMPSNTNVFGDGATTIIRPLLPNASNFALGADSGSPTQFIDNITIRDIMFLGYVATHPFSEHMHLIHINGVRNVLIENCRFVGFRGDGIYLGSSIVAQTERHNLNVTIRSCTFDGLNKDNRNAISVIDGAGVLIDDCYFTRCSRFNMPGPICIEPNPDIFAVIRNITVANCKFIDNGGNVAAINVHLPGINYTVPPQSITIANNYIDTAHVGVHFGHAIPGGHTQIANSHSVKICNNYVTNCVRPFSIIGAKRVLIEGNDFSFSTQSAILGFTDVSTRLVDVDLIGNHFRRCATLGGAGLAIFGAAGLRIERNIFEDCGSGAPGASNSISFDTGITSNVTIAHNTFSSPTGKTLVAVQRESTAVLTPETNSVHSNSLGGMPVFITVTPNAASVPNYLADGNLFTPVVFGTAGAGTATYTTQVGRFTRIGNLIQFQLEVTWSGHTGTGACAINLPAAISTRNPEFTACSCVTSGITYPAGAQPACLAVTSASQLQLYTQNAGALLQAPIPAAGTLIISGMYVTN